VIEYRCFRNDDPPRLADIWRSAELGPAAVQPMTADLLEGAVLAKPYFDREGIVIAFDGERPVGFAHAGFGPTADGRGLDHSVGIIPVIAVVPHRLGRRIGDELLGHGEAYLRRHGARRLQGGGSGATRGFYLGLYGGADLPGVLESSPALAAVFTRGGYRAAERIAVVSRRLAGFRPAVSRTQLALRRSSLLRPIDEPPHRHWWEAATTTGLPLRRYELVGADGAVMATATFWDMYGLAGCPPASRWGLLDVEVPEPLRRRGLGHHVLGEALFDLAEEGGQTVEAQAGDAHPAACGLFAKLGFAPIAFGTLYEK
jgi:ribosomal protein S18 acetylase RimI-like enzyme